MQEGEEEVRARVCTEAMDFMEGMRDGWNGLIPPVVPNLVSFNIIIKVGRRRCMCVCVFVCVVFFPRFALPGELYCGSGNG